MLRALSIAEAMIINLDISHLFQAALNELIARRSELNQMDLTNQDHGDHMVQIFQAAVQAAQEKGAADLSATMEYASQLLLQFPENGSARLYSHGLACLAAELRKRNINLDDLAPYINDYLQGAPGFRSDAPGSSADVLKALLSALAEWERLEGQQPGADGGLNLGYLLGIGMAYMQAKAQGGDKLQVLAETIVSASPIGRVPHRRSSGLTVVRTILQEMGKMSASDATA